MNVLGYLEKVVKIVDKYGGWKILQAIVSVALFLFVVFYVPTMTKIMVKQATIETSDERDYIKEEEHKRMMTARRDIQPRMTATLKNLLIETNADRAFVIELHNGLSNYNGIPFLHGSVTYEEVSSNIEPIDEEFQNLSLSRFKMPSYLHKYSRFFGTIEELEKIDPKLALKLRMNDVQYIAVGTLYNGTTEWGWFGILYDDKSKIVEMPKITAEFAVSGQLICRILLTIKEYEKKHDK